MSRKGFTLAELLAAISILLMVATILVPSLRRATRHSKVEVCAGHLKTLHKAAAGAPASPELGGKYWVRLTQTQPPRVSPDVLLCPLVEEAEFADLPYMGPGADPSQAAPGDPIGCDVPTAHSRNGKEGGNVLLKSGEVVTDHTGLWSSASRTGKGRP